MAAGVRIWELGVGSKGGYGCAKRGTASPDSSGRRGQIMAGLGGCEERSVPMRWSSSIEDFGIHAATGVRSQETGDGGCGRRS